jgi:hypothetical protein
MLWDASAINGYAIDASDGRLGTVRDLLFDDVDWTIRWLVVDTGDWLPGRKVRLPVSVLGRPDPAAESFPVKLTKAEVASSAELPGTPAKGDDRDLHGIASIIGSHVHATDGEIGHVENFLMDDADWGIKFLTVHTSNWLPAEKVLISPRSVHEVHWEQGHIHVDVNRKQVEDSPRHDPSATVDGAFEEKFLTYYGIRWIEREDAATPSVKPSTAPRAAL